MEESNFESLSRIKVEEAMREFNGYLTSQYDGMLSILGNYESIFIKIDLKLEDCDLFLKKIEKYKNPKIIRIGQYDFEYIGQYKTDENSPILKFNKGLFALNFAANLESLKKYVIDKGFNILSKFKILNVTIVEGNDNSMLKYASKAKIFKVKINETDSLIKEKYGDEDGFIFVSTNDPSLIYNNFGIDNVISIEKVGSTYII